MLTFEIVYLQKVFSESLIAIFEFNVIQWCNVLYYFIKHVHLFPADDQTNYYNIGVYDIACVWQ